LNRERRQPGEHPATKMSEGEGYKIELFIFPDGTEVEMVVFDREAAPSRLTSEPASPEPAKAKREARTAKPSATPPPPEGPDAGDDAHLCPLCESTLVYPIDWVRNSEATWNITLRCPNCEMQRAVTLGRASVEEYNRELYHGAQALAREAETMTRRNFEEEADRIVEALGRGLILPMDF
jgi:hypothetical protein